EDYYAVISLHDGRVLHVACQLLTSLGYAKDSWTGKLFIDFIDTKDKKILTERIANEIVMSRDFRLSGTSCPKSSNYCRLRNVDGQNVPFRIHLVIQNYQEDKSLPIPKNQILLLVAFFQPIRSAYKEPDEKIVSTTFTTCHTASCRLSYVDPDITQYLGYLPQDMIDHCVFDFYYPEDMTLIKEIYETVIGLESSSFRAKPYRFIVQNGGVIVLETEWSSFVNPWTKNLEFVIGQHRVLKGPTDPDIFRPPGNLMTDTLANIDQDVLRKARTIQDEIRTLLIEGVQRKLQNTKNDIDLLSKRQELSSFLENILQEIKIPSSIKDPLAVDYRSFSEHGSVMLGEISPHHEYYDSKSSTETPPSYNQLNYHDNIERFFNSNIVESTTKGPFGSDEENLNSCVNSSEGNGKNNPNRPDMKCTSSTNISSNSGSAENLSNGSNNQQSFSCESGDTTNSNNSTGNGHVKPPLLTESLLNKHNETMEKLMVQKHRELKKASGKRNKSSGNEKAKNTSEQIQIVPNGSRAEPMDCSKATKKPHRLKRCGSQNQEDHKNSKMSKQNEISKMPQNPGHLASGQVNCPTITANPVPSWHPLTTMPSTAPITSQCFSTTTACSPPIARFSAYPQMYPVYYMPIPQQRENPQISVVPQEHPGPPNSMNPFCFVPVPYMTPMSNMMYPSYMAPSAAMMYRSYMQMPQAHQTQAQNNQNENQPCPDSGATATTSMPMATNVSSSDKLPASQADSVKVEPTTVSESSKRIFSPFGIVSSCVSNDDGAYSKVVDESCEEMSNAMDHSTSDRKAHRSRKSSYLDSSVPKSCGSSERPFTISSFESKETRSSDDNKSFGMVRKEPPWIEGINVTPELIYQYQITPKSFDDVLKADFEYLRHVKQPSLVNEQLGQLFLDLELEGFGSKLILEMPNDASTASSSDSDTSHRLVDKIP
ncbi:hypothetical protein QAD02_009835, partial [Eretmocerus hayati]